MKKDKSPKVRTLDFEKDFLTARASQTDNVGGVIARMTAMTQDGAPTQTKDSYVNLAAKLGIQASNMSSQSYYNLGPFITRNRLELEAAYRGNWVVGKVVDCVAEDMTRDGITMQSEMDPDDISDFQIMISEFSVWESLCSTIKWARLYGGAVAVMLIDGANYSDPLDIEAIKKDSFKGLLVFDRWMLQPSMGELVTDICKDIGKPMYYEVMPGVSVFPGGKIHYSRVLRFDGIELPFYQKLFENYWGLSVVERMLDRLTAFDSSTLGAAQLLYKAHLRVLSIKGFREALANGGKEEDAVVKQFEYIRALQCNEGMTVLDSEDKFDTHSYQFSGVSDALQQLGQQISGCVDIPLVRLFGQSPAGFSAGDADLRNYYDSINRRQKNEIRPNLDKLLAVMHMSRFGQALPEDFEYDFVSLWQLSEKEKSEIAQADAATIAATKDSGLISGKTALLELKQLSRVTDRFTNISKEDIKNAEEDITPPSPLLEGGLEPIIPEEEKMTETPIQEAEHPNERLGSENPDLLEEGAKDRMTFRDFLENFNKKMASARKTFDAAFNKDEVKIVVDLENKYKKR